MKKSSTSKILSSTLWIVFFEENVRYFAVSDSYSNMLMVAKIRTTNNNKFLEKFFVRIIILMAVMKNNKLKQKKKKKTVYYGNLQG